MPPRLREEVDDRGTARRDSPSNSLKLQDNLWMVDIDYTRSARNHLRFYEKRAILSRIGRRRLANFIERANESTRGIVNKLCTFSPSCRASNWWFWTRTSFDG
jgi:hypothetical protein